MIARYAEGSTARRNRRSETRVATSRVLATTRITGGQHISAGWGDCMRMPTQSQDVTGVAQVEGRVNHVPRVAE
jgi:hypothetical protein